MTELRNTKRLKKELGLLNVYAIATGATLSSGFFLLPGLAAAGAGPALPLSYLLAALFIMPGLVSKTELATAMPRSGGIYYFIDRSLGPLFGTIAGFGTWFALILKTAFALVGVGAYLSLYLPDVQMQPIAASFAIVFGILNLLGAKKSGSAQVFLVVGLLLLLGWFSGFGAVNMTAANFTPFFEKGGASIVSTAGLVIVSYMGLTKVASIAEEVRDPERNLPLGMFLAFATAIVIYVIGTSVMIGVVSVDGLAQQETILTPVATVADALVGPWGVLLMTVAAILAFSSVANAGILSASRYPMAMSRDRLLPDRLGRIGERGTPHLSILLTVSVILVFVTVLDPTKIAKLAGAFQLIMFALSSLAVIVMRESRIEAYDPSFKSPLYPWLQLAGIAAPFWLIAQMGGLTIVFTLGLITVGTIWYTVYARKRIVRTGALFHVFANIARRHFGRDYYRLQASPETTESLDHLVLRGFAIDLDDSDGFEDAVRYGSTLLSERVSIGEETLNDDFLKTAGAGVLSVTPGIALAHIHLPHILESELVIARSRGGIVIEEDDPYFEGHVPAAPVHAVFLLVAPKSNPGQHLRILAQIAGRIVEEDFLPEWMSADTVDGLKYALLQDAFFVTLHLLSGDRTEHLIGKEIREVSLGEGCLIISITRDGLRHVPRGNTRLKEGDHMTIMGDPGEIRKLTEAYAV